MYKIDKGIPLPPANRGRSIGSKDPNSRMGVIRRMEVGDSVFFERPAGMKANRLSITICATVRVIRKRDIPNFNYATRTTIEDGKPGVRLWRLAEKTQKHVENPALPPSVRSAYETIREYSGGLCA